MHDELPGKARQAPFQPVNSDPVKPDCRHQHAEEPGEKVIARGRGGVEQGHNVLRERCDPDQAQPRIKLASAHNDINNNGDPRGIQRDRGIRFRRAAKPLPELKSETPKVLAV